MNEIGKRLFKRLMNDLRARNASRRKILQNEPYHQGYEDILGIAENTVETWDYSSHTFDTFTKHLQKQYDKIYMKEPHRGLGAYAAILDIFDQLGAVL